MYKRSEIGGGVGMCMCKMTSTALDKFGTIALNKLALQRLWPISLFAFHLWHLAYLCDCAFSSIHGILCGNQPFIKLQHLLVSLTIEYHTHRHTCSYVCQIFQQWNINITFITQDINTKIFPWRAALCLSSFFRFYARATIIWKCPILNPTHHI